MQVRLITTIATIVEVSEGVTLEEAKKEIFGRYNEALDTDADQEQCVDAVQSLQNGAVVFDTVIATEVTHSFEEVK